MGMSPGRCSFQRRFDFVWREGHGAQSHAGGFEDCVDWDAVQHPLRPEWVVHRCWQLDRCAQIPTRPSEPAVRPSAADTGQLIASNGLTNCSP
jgi:hypothetical protein